MINLIALLQPSEDRDGVFNGRLINLHRLETTLKSGILLDVFAVLIQGGSADAVQLASCQHRLEEVTGIHTALGFPRADDVVQLIDEKDDTAFTLADFIQHRLEPFLKFAAVLCAGDQRSHVQGEDGFILEAFRHVSADDSLREPFRDGRFAHARFADQYRVVLCLSGEDADDIPDFGITADHRVQLILSCTFYQIRAVFGKSIVSALRVVSCYRRSFHLGKFS